MKINPFVGAAIAAIVLVVVGFLSLKVYQKTNGDDKQVVVKIPNPNDPRFKADPRLAGGGGGK